MQCENSNYCKNVPIWSQIPEFDKKTLNFVKTMQIDNK